MNSEACTEPGRTTALRSSAWACPISSQPASCAVCAAVITRPADTRISIAPVTAKNRDRLSRTPPR